MQTHKTLTASGQVLKGGGRLYSVHGDASAAIVVNIRNGPLVTDPIICTLRVATAGMNEVHFGHRGIAVDGIYVDFDSGTGQVATVYEG